MALCFGGKSYLLAQWSVFSGHPVIECSLVVSTATLIRPLSLSHCIYCKKVAIAVYVNATIFGYSLKKDATSFKNIGRFSPVLVKPGRFGLILVWVDSALKVNHLGFDSGPVCLNFNKAH